MTVGRFKLVLWNNERTFDEMKLEIQEMSKKYEWSYFHCAQEVCPDTGREHIDAYYETPSQRRFETELKKFNKKFGHGFGDLQVARGTAAENKDYSKKENGDFYSEGTIAPAGQGTRTDVKKRCQAVLDGEITVDEIMMEDPAFYHSYGRTLHKVEDVALRKRFRTEMTQGIWLYGPTGVGKSHACLHNFNPATHYIWKLRDKGWQDDYVGQEIVIINEFRGSIDYDELLEMVDKWPYSVPRRGRPPVPFLAKKVIITSPLHPEEVYCKRHAKDSLEQLKRRFQIIHMDGSEV